MLWHQIGQYQILGTTHPMTVFTASKTVRIVAFAFGDANNKSMNKNMTRIRVGFGTNGDIYQDLEKAKACNFCIYFQGYGLHWVCGHCSKLNKEIEGGYVGGYSKTAKECDSFTVRPELLEKE